jgi:hypothetical protein
LIGFLLFLGDLTNGFIGGFGVIILGFRSIWAQRAALLRFE